MKIVLSVAVACALVLVTVFIGLDHVSSDPSTEQLDKDIAAVSAQIKDAETEGGQYAGGAIQSLIFVRIQVLKTTLAMLEQKRTSILRRVDLVYSVDGEEVSVNADIISSLDLDKFSEELGRFKSEAALYSGGLIQSIALVNAATTEMTLAQLRQRRLAEQYGFQFRLSGTVAPASETVSLNIVEDGEAL